MADRRAVAAAIAIAIAVPAEGLRQWAYRDEPGILTICYGHTGPDVVKARRYSLDECRSLLNADMLKAVDTVERCSPGLPEPVLAAFSDAVFNLGPRVACDRKNSTAARLLAQGRIPEACEQLPRWNKASVAGVLVELPGLTARRLKERELCLSNVTSVSPTS
jgi:GH24 family phage-related lysozyme (muramidase)